MLGIFPSILLGLIALFLIFIFKVNFAKRNQPPGPLCLPIIGNLLQIAWLNHKQPYLAFSKMSEKYGNVLSIQLGSVSSVVFNSFEEMDEYLNKPEYSERLFTQWMGLRNGSEQEFHKRLGIAFSAFPNPWHEVKRITLKTLRDIGFGKRSGMHAIVQEELTDVVNELKADIAKAKNGIITFDSYFNLSLLNLIWGFVTGKRFEHNNPRLLSLIQIMKTMLASTNLGNSLVFAFPEWVDYLPKWTGTGVLRSGYKTTNNFFKEFIDERRSLGAYKTNPENFVDEFLQEIDAHKEQPIDENGLEFSDQQLVMVMHDLFFAGSETSSGTTSYFLLYLVRNPEVQKKLQKEIDSILPHGTFPEPEHETQLHYVRATIAETHRVASILPLMVPRATTQDTVCGKYFVPKNTYIIGNLSAMLSDKKYWKDPENFRPERFLDENGKYKGDPRLKPFGFGKRACLGEPLAQMSMFYYVTVLMQNFTFLPVPNEPLPSNDPVPGMTNAPPTFRAVVKCRN